ncbi:cell division protein FtsK/SpoIIIE, partial [Candidatus Thiomargarita nelsonii]
MAGKIETDTQDEELIQSILLYGLQKQVPKWTVLRIALAKSLQMPIPPDDSLDRLESRGSEYRLEQVTGLGKTPDELGSSDLTDAICALLSVFHNENLFEDDKRFCQLLQRHIRRGLQEIRWRSDEDFHDYLYQALFVNKNPLTANYSQWNQALISYFTTGIPQGSQIYLSVDDDVLESIGQYFSPSGGNWCADFCAAVKKEVIVDGQVKLSHLQGRDEQGLPKSVAFLSAMVLAAYHMAEDEEVNQSNFFRRFKEILDLPISGNSRPIGMKEEELLWQDWALWLRQNGFVPSAQRGEGSRTYINYPISQTLLRQSDKDQ